MARIAKSERLLNLLSFLLKSRRAVRLAEIRESVVGYCEPGAGAASVERRFERDKATLRDLGVPLTYVGEEDLDGPGYVIPRDAYFLPRLDLSSAETAILAGAGRFALAETAGPVSDALKSAVRKLQFDSPIPGGIRVTSEEHFVFHRQQAPSDSRVQQNLRDLTAAVLNRRVVRFMYYAMGGDRVSRRVVEPYGIGFADGHWYLAGFDRGRQGVRVFRIDRIRGAVKRLHPQATRAEFDVPPDFRIQDHVGLPPWLFGKAKKTAVRMRFDADTAFMVRDDAAPGDKWEEHADGSATLTRWATNPDALLNWVLGFGRHVKVLDPPTFREQTAEALRTMAAIHEGRGAGGGRS